MVEFFPGDFVGGILSWNPLKQHITRRWLVIIILFTATSNYKHKLGYKNYAKHYLHYIIYITIYITTLHYSLFKT